MIATSNEENDSEVVKMGGGSTSYSDSRSSYNWSDDQKVTRRSSSSYTKSDKREYTDTSSKGMRPPVGLDIKTDSEFAAVLMVDITGSMSKWPSLIFEKIPALYNESNAAVQGLSLDDLKKVKEPKEMLELAVIAIGDGPQGDGYPLQVVDYSKGKKLVEGVNRIYPEGGGGGNAVESYDLGAYFLLHHSKTPNCPKPTLIIAGDEGFYDPGQPSMVQRYIGDTVSGKYDTNKLMKDLAKKFDVFVLRPETAHYDTSTYARIHSQWQEVFPERVTRMQKPERLVDCFIISCGIAADNYNNSVDMLKRRQTPAQVKDVLDAIHPFVK